MLSSHTHKCTETGATLPLLLIAIIVLTLLPTDKPHHLASVLS